ncbi:magnesium dechelatase SGRL, chloroplastic [Andrographis paniculata]|uniref:magnesium dechelatase SGRL, chloroplastic n=1 Tax=Andrographis paniculata TaxID=175694 RepID=UPI0021E93AF6|nr:magnesium dechelatase SGRL, chloroplastic [Andrographis paniculata]
MMQTMAATHSAPAFSSSYYIHSCKKMQKPSPPLPHAWTDRTPSYNSLVFQAARLLGPPARFEASKLKVLFMGKQAGTPTKIVPRTYTLSHCDFTANLTLTISDIILRDQLNGWYNKDDVVAEWTQLNDKLILNVHCYVSGPHSLSDMAAEFRYHIFSKELPLVLEALLYGDSDLFRQHQELMDALVRVYFHSSFQKYNRVECWGPLRDAARGKGVDKINGYVAASKERRSTHKSRARQKSIFQAVLTFLL